MDNETINLIKNLFEEYANKDSGTVTAAYITIGGMLGVAILGAILQLKITKRIVSEEHKKMLVQINSEINPTTVKGYVLRIQLLLNTNDPNQDRVNQLVIQLALTVNGWQPAENPSELLRIHDQLLEETKLLIYRPLNNA